MTLYIDHDPLNPRYWPEYTVVMNDFSRNIPVDFEADLEIKLDEEKSF